MDWGWNIIPTDELTHSMINFRGVGLAQPPSSLFLGPHRWILHVGQTVCHFSTKQLHQITIEKGGLETIILDG